jgi:dextranase
MIKRQLTGLWLAAILMLALACEKDDGGEIDYIPDTTGERIEVVTDKSAYQPGEEVKFKCNKTYQNAWVRYMYLGQSVGEAPLGGSTWTWNPPSVDFRGYMAEIFTRSNDGSEQILGTVAVDVSSDWSKFPRYGFLSEYGQLSDAQMNGVIDNLTKYHINGLQFYDWMYRQHKPLAGTVSDPMPFWNDIINRQNYKSTVEGYIGLAHQKNMKAMFYNLAFGVLNDYDPAQITPQMFLYKDAGHSVKDRHELGPPFISSIYLTDPANSNWLGYLAQQNDDVYQVFDFDGYHIDQLGDRGNIYKYDGSPANLRSAYPTFISAMKNAHPEKRLVFNAVNQYGQEQMAGGPLEFMYTEVWAPNDGFKDLTNILENNHDYSGGKNSVLAAYINYDKAENPGVFNTPGVLLADAVIFAFGGSHLELGEHMLGKEYFPNRNLSMSAELKTRLVEYYDFMVAYQNLLRDGGTFNNPVITTGDGKLNLGTWPPTMGKVAAIGKKVGNRQVVHLLNFTNANSLNWRDLNGTQNVPAKIEMAMVNLQISQPVTKVWYASPDYRDGAAIPLEFTQTGSTVNIKVPFLQYWGMIVIE